MLKKVILFLTFFVIATVGVIVYVNLTEKLTSISVPNIPSVSFSDLIKLSRFSLEKAPSKSLVGSIKSLTGDVHYTARLATESAKIVLPLEIQQGESVTTGSDGAIDLYFAKAAEVSINPNTKVEVIQTLPDNLVFLQRTGVADYKRLSISPVSIRSYHLLIDNNGLLTVSVNKVKPIISVRVKSGSASLAYNNLNNDTRTIKVAAGETAIFDDSSRRVTIETN